MTSNLRDMELRIYLYRDIDLIPSMTAEQREELRAVYQARVNDLAPAKDAALAAMAPGLTMAYRDVRALARTIKSYQKAVTYLEKIETAIEASNKL